MSFYTSQLETRISLFRTKFKTAASARTLGYYSLAGPKCTEYVEELLTRKRYIYPGDIKVSQTNTWSFFIANF